MATSSKYAVQIVQDESVWTANITRRVSRKEVKISKSQTGFATEAEAQTWGEAELKGFVDNQGERNKRHNAKR